MRIVALLFIVAGCQSASTTVSVNQKSAAAIRSALEAERKETSILRAKLAVEDRDEQIRAATVYLDKLIAINTTNCPQDFTLAFKNYFNAWRGFRDALKSRNSDTTAAAARCAAGSCCAKSASPTSGAR
jgi:hypothetical protein